MNQLEQLDALCNHVKTHNISDDLLFDEAVKFMNEIHDFAPLIADDIRENFQDVTAIADLDMASVADTFLSGRSMLWILESLTESFVDSVNEQIADCVNANEINEPEEECGMTLAKIEAEKMMGAT